MQAMSMNARKRATRVIDREYRKALFSCLEILKDAGIGPDSIAWQQVWRLHDRWRERAWHTAMRRIDREAAATER
jgi:hypothetical protein